MGTSASKTADPMAVKDIVEEVIAGNTVTIFSKSYCPYCTQAKNLFVNQYPDVQTKVLELNERDDGSDIQAYLLQKTGQRTVPNIFINQKHIGGCDDVVAANAQGTLKVLLAKSTNTS